MSLQHRDLKLDNILTDASKEGADVKLVDFGLSAHFEDFRLEHDVVGTWVRQLVLYVSVCTTLVTSSRVVLCRPRGGLRHHLHETRGMSCVPVSINCSFSQTCFPISRALPFLARRPVKAGCTSAPVLLMTASHRVVFYALHVRLSL